MAHKRHVLDRLADAVEADRGMALSASDAATLADEIAELELAREIDALLFDRIICDLKGVTSKLTN
jgi:hypothetical protein